MACSKACRYGALTDITIKKGKPGVTCTLCGDCINSCTKNAIAYNFPGLNPSAANKIFFVIAIVIHTLFIGIGRV